MEHRRWKAWRGILLFTDSALQVCKEPGLCPEQKQTQLILTLRGSEGLLRFESPAMLKITFQAISAWDLELC